MFAIPGDVGRPTSAGTNALIADGVPLVTCASDVAALMRWECATLLNLAVSSGSGAGVDSIQAAGSLVAMLAQPQTVDELAVRTGASAADISAQLMLLELQGSVERRPGGAYSAVRRRAAANPSA